MYDWDPGQLSVVLVIGHCVNTTEAMMETAHLIEEDGHEVYAVWGAKLKAGLQLSPCRIVCRC